jgi:hypothetical protein
MPRPASKLIQPKGPSKSIFQPHPATAPKGSLPGTPTTSSGKASKAAPPNGGKPA